MGYELHRHEAAKYVEERFSKMASLKAHRLPAVKSYQAEYKDSPTANVEGTYRTNVGFALVQNKTSDFIATMPKFDFQPLSEEAQDKIPVVKRVWDFWWRVGGVEREILPVVIDSNVTGCGYATHYIRSYEREISLPDGKGGWEKKTVTEEKPVLERVPWENAFINAHSIDAATECIIVRHWNRSEFLTMRAEWLKESKKSADSIPMGKRYDWYESANSYDVRTGIYTGKTDALREEIVSELHWYSKFEDKYVVIANGEKIHESPLPSLHKELPLLLLNDHWVPDDHTGRGEYDITADARKLKDAVAQLGIDLTKASVGAMFASPEAGIDSGEIKFSIKEINECQDVDALHHFTPNVNLQYVQFEENKADEYIIQASGQDFKGLLMGPSETASKTVAKVETQKRRVALTQRQAAWTFFERLARLRMSDIALLHKERRTIAVQGETVVNGVSRNLNGGYGVFTVEPKHFTDAVNVLPNIESMAVDSSQERQDFLQAVQIFGGMSKTDGSPLVQPEFWLQSGRPYYPSLDFGRASGESEVSKSPEEIMTEAGVIEQPSAPAQMQEMGMAGADNPNFVPPAQRSGATKRVSTPGSAPKINSVM